MSEIAPAAVRIVRRSALAHPPLGGPAARLWMRALAEGHVLQALVSPDAGEVEAHLIGLGDGSPFAVRPLAPGQWFVVGDRRLSPSEVAGKVASVADVMALCDQSDGRVRIGLGGAAAETVLSRGTAVDVSRAAFPVGRSAQTLFGHIGIHLTRVADEDFEMLVLRSFAESLWEELATAAKGRLSAR